MKGNYHFEQAINENAENLFERGIHPAVLAAYKESRELDNEYLNFRTLFIDDVDGIAVCLKGHEIGSFTVSERSTGLIDCAVIFEQHGFNLTGVYEVYTNPNHNESVKAFGFSMGWGKMVRGY